MKKIAILTLVLMLIFALAACGNTKPTQLGTSDFSIVLPDGYASTEDDFDEAVASPFYAVKTNAFKQIAVGMDENATTYTCIGAIIFAIVGGIDRLLLIALTAYSFVLSKKAKNKEQI